jgi:chromosome segregation ATPase
VVLIRSTNRRDRSEKLQSLYSILFLDRLELTSLKRGKEKAMGRKEAYIEKLEAQLREWSSKIDELKARADKAKTDVKLEYEEKIGELRARQETVRNKLQELKDSSGEAWEGIRDGLEKAWDELKNAVSGALDRGRRRGPSHGEVQTFPALTERTRELEELDKMVSWEYYEDWKWKKKHT